MVTYALALAAFIAAGALIWSVMTYVRSASMSHYGELDRMYADLLRLGIEKPHLRRGHDVKRDSDQEDEYFTYAYMVWKFIEAVHDRAFADKTGYAAWWTWWTRDQDQVLRATWGAVIEVEHEKFGPWLTENFGMFKEPFPRFIFEHERGRRSGLRKRSR
jgi:hypothetical protein